jgi:hypothetical protein
MSRQSLSADALIRRALAINVNAPLPRHTHNEMTAFAQDPGPSRGDPSRHALRPTEASKVATCYVRFTSTRAVRCAQKPVIRRRRGKRQLEVGSAS